MNQSSDNCQPALERNTRPNHPPSRPRPHQPIFQRSCGSPENALHCSLLPPFAPAALPQLDILRPMKTVCPSYECPLNHAERTATLPAQPFSIRPLSALPPKPFFRTSQIVSDRLRSSGIVSDRPGSSERTAAHRPPFPQNCRNVCPTPPAKPAKKRVKARHFASFRVKICPPTPVRKKGFSATFGSG